MLRGKIKEYERENEAHVKDNFKISISLPQYICIYGKNKNTQQKQK